MNRKLAIALRIALVGAIAALLWLFLREIQWSELGTTLENARLWPLVPAVGISFAMLWFASIGLRVMLAPRHVVPVRRLFRYTIVAFAASVIAPVRAGELVRLWLLKQRDAVPVADSAAAVVAQKIIDGMTMFVFIAPIPLLVPDVPAWVGRAILVGAAIAVVVFIALYVAVGRIERRTSQTWFARFVAGMHVVRDPRRLGLVFAAQLAAWSADLVMVSLVLYAVGIDLPIAAGLLILMSINLAIIVPTPANIGSLEVGVFAATRILGVADERALAFALLYHASQVVPILIAGFALEARVLLGRDSSRSGDPRERL